MKKQQVSSSFLLWGGLVLFVCAYGTYIYLTEYWYQQPAYVIGVVNETDEEVDDVALTFSPEGDFEFGVLASNAPKKHMDPPWSIPQKVGAVFTYLIPGKGRDIFSKKIPTHLTKNFKGEIIIVIFENDVGEIDIKIRATPTK